MTSNVKGVLGKKKLSPNWIEKIKQVVFNQFPLETVKLMKRPGPAAEKPLMKILES